MSSLTQTDTSAIDRSSDARSHWHLSSSVSCPPGLSLVVRGRPRAVQSDAGLTAGGKSVSVAIPEQLRISVGDFGHSRFHSELALRVRTQLTFLTRTMLLYSWIFY